MQIGEVHGNVYIGGPAPESEVSLDLDAYREHQLSQLAIWERQYTRLDVDPAVALAGQDLRALPDSRLALTEALLRHKRLVVVGGAGAGKTTSMLYLVASVLPGGALAGSLVDFVPLYIELGRFRSDASTSPLDQLLSLIAETLFLGKACSEPPSLRGVRHLLASHRFLLLLDGLNEAQAEVRASCLTAINDLAKLYSDHRIVLSSRPHGFSPPQGWEVVLLRELDDAQIPGFVERYTQDELSQPLLQTVLEAHNPLLRLPLFLSLVVRMSGSPLPDFQRRLRSRSGLVAQYVEFLLQRDLTSADKIFSLDRLRGALDRLAQAFQTSGQVLPLVDARAAVEPGALGHSEETRQILDNLCERGLLATDGQNLRFWHQTIQEYFYAGSIVRRWRGSKKQIGRMPWSLRRLAAKAEEEEALSFIVAHLRNEEAEAALCYGLRVNPALAISWADDLCLEGRAMPATDRFPARVRRFVLAARRYSILGTNPVFILLALWVLGPVLGALLELGGMILMTWLGFDPSTDGGIGCIFALLFGYVPFLDALFLCPSVKKLEPLLMTIPGIRDNSLRKELGAVAQEISYSKVTRPETRAIARGISVIKAGNGEELVMSLRNSDAPHITVRLIGHLDMPLAIPFLTEILKLNNFLSLGALAALAMRASRQRNERQEVKNLLWAVWKNGDADNLSRLRARKLLLREGEHPGGRALLIRYFAFRSLQVLTVTLYMLCMALIAIFQPLAIFPALLLGCALIGWDAHRIGARIVPGRLSGTPSGWALSALLLSFLVIPFYLLNRRRIRKDSVSVDWDAILQAIQTKDPHGASLSITHPPSAFR